MKGSRGSTQYLDLGDYLLIAEAVLGIDADKLARLDRIDLADSALAAPAASFAGVEAYPAFEQKAAVLLWHLVRNHPLPDGNKRAAYIATIEFVRRNGRGWQSASPEENDRVIRGVAAGDVSQEDLVVWVTERIRDLPMHLALAQRR